MNANKINSRVVNPPGAMDLVNRNIAAAEAEWQLAKQQQAIEKQQRSENDDNQMNSKYVFNKNVIKALK